MTEPGAPGRGAFCPSNASAATLSVEQRFPPGAIVDHLPAMLVFHLLPAFAFVAGTQTTDAQAGLRIELADIDAGRFDTHVTVGVQTLGCHCRIAERVQAM